MKLGDALKPKLRPLSGAVAQEDSAELQLLS